MGFRYRKSINLGGGFRVNFSKSGIGYSWGTKGYRVTHKAGGGVRKTYSIPGTGLSWSQDSGRGKRKGRRSASRSNYPQQQVASTGNIVYEAQDIDASEVSSDNAAQFIEAVKRYAGLRAFFIFGIVLGLFLGFVDPLFLIVPALGIIGLILLRREKICIEYEFDDFGNRRMQSLEHAMNSLMGSSKLWQVNSIQKNLSTKTNAGAAHNIRRTQVKFRKKTPFFLKTDATCYSIALKNGQIYVLPDRLVVSGKKGWGVVEYDDLDIDVGTQIFIENEPVPKDATIIGYTWQYVNKNGSPDRRYKNNRQLPECEYGKLRFRIGSAFDVILHVSNIDNAKSFQSDVNQMIEETKQARIEAAQEAENAARFDSIPASTFSVSTEGVVAEPMTSGTLNYQNNQDFMPSDLTDSEKSILGAFWNGVEENNIPKNCMASRNMDGSISVSYQGKTVGSFRISGDNGWLVYPLGNSGKTKTVEGNQEVLIENVNKWFRFILNYMQ